MKEKAKKVLDKLKGFWGGLTKKVRIILSKAKGGVLFVDEAYSLASKPGSSGSSFNEECIETVVC